MNLVFQPVKDDDGRVNSIMLIAHEVTDIVVARNHLNDAEQRTRLAVEAAHIGTFEWNLANQSFVYSSRFAEIFGCRGQMNYSRKYFTSLIHPLDKEVMETAHKDAYTTVFCCTRAVFCCLTVTSGG